MRRLFFGLILALLLLLAILALSGCHPRCEPTAIPAVPATCTESGLTEGSRCAICEAVLVAQEITEPTGHTAVTDRSVPATCTESGLTEGSHCAACQVTLVPQSAIPMLSHDYVDDRCSVCGGYDPSRVAPYVSYEGYAYFETAKNGAAMRAFYDHVDADLIDFHLNRTRDATENALDLRYPTIAGYDYKQFGLSLDEAFTVFSYYRKDHPLYYWLAYYLSWNGDELFLHTAIEHASGESRAIHNRNVYDGIADYLACTEGAETDYDTVLALYDEILARNRYGDEAEGAPLLTEIWAHNILGAFEYGTFVCEGYSKLLQLLLNCTGIENRHVVGNEHAWSLIRLDDGRWYWFDPTWDDTAEDGVCRYTWFCKAENEFPSHTPSYRTACIGFTVYINMTLPDRADTPFALDGVFELGETVTVDGTVYRRTSFDTVTSVGSTDPSAPPVETVTLFGRTYTVE